MSAAAIAKAWSEDIHHVLWRWSPAAAWAHAVGDGESRGSEGLFVDDAGVTYITAPPNVHGLRRAALSRTENIDAAAFLAPPSRREQLPTDFEVELRHQLDVGAPPLR